jgi:hypothetical protein
MFPSFRKSLCVAALACTAAVVLFGAGTTHATGLDAHAAGPDAFRSESSGRAPIVLAFQQTNYLYFVDVRTPHQTHRLECGQNEDLAKLRFDNYCNHGVPTKWGYVNDSTGAEVEMNRSSNW